jgi:hypothetical protein
MPPLRHEPTIPESERPQTHALDRAATGIGYKCNTLHKMKNTKIGTFTSWDRAVLEKFNVAWLVKYLYESQRLTTLLTKANPHIHSLLSKIHFNIILPPRYRSPKLHLLFRFFNWSVLWISHFPTLATFRHNVQNVCGIGLLTNCRRLLL